MAQSRHPKGTPDGGRFAAQPRTEASTTLLADRPDAQSDPLIKVGEPLATFVGINRQTARCERCGESVSPKRGVVREADGRKMTWHSSPCGDRDYSDAQTLRHESVDSPVPATQAMQRMRNGETMYGRVPPSKALARGYWIENDVVFCQAADGPRLANTHPLHEIIWHDSREDAVASADERRRTPEYREWVEQRQREREAIAARGPRPGSHWTGD